MQASIEKCKNENSNPISMSQEKPVKKLSRHARYNKKRKLEKEQKNSSLSADYNMSRPILPLITGDIIFNPDRVYIVFALFSSFTLSCLGYFCVDRSII
jgi:hypothetical protein